MYEWINEWMNECNGRNGFWKLSNTHTIQMNTYMWIYSVIYEWINWSDREKKKCNNKVNGIVPKIPNYYIV